MKKLLALLCLAYCFSAIRSQNILGSYITYTAIDSVAYEVTVNVFTDCSVTGAPAIKDSLEVSWGTGSSQRFMSKLTFVSSADVTGIHDRCAIKSLCSGGSYPIGIQQNIYKTTVDVSAVNPCEITFAWFGNLRSSKITTGAASQAHYNYSVVNKCGNLKNNSATLVSNLQFLLGLGRNYEPGVISTDADSDSLGYTLVSPLASPTTNSTYSGFWTYKIPVSFLGSPNSYLNHPAGFRFDGVTGLFDFRPTASGQQTIYCAEVSEWRNIAGVSTKIGLIRYDLPWLILNLPNNNQPVITADKPFNYMACEGDSVKIKISVKDFDNNDTVKVSWITNQIIPGADIHIEDTTNPQPTVLFSWLPARTHVSNTPYTLSVSAVDNACPLPGVTKNAVNITVLKYPEASDFAVASKTPKCNSAKIKINRLNNLPLMKFTLMDEDSILAVQADSAELLFKGSGWKKFYITAVNGPSCSATFTDSVFIAPDYTINLATKNDTGICRNDSAFIFTAPLNGTGPYRYFWKGMKADSNKDRPSYQESVTASRNYRIYVSDSNRCAGYESAIITMYDLPVTTLTVTTVACKNDTVYLDGNTISGKAPFHYAWSGIDTAMNIPVKMDATRVFNLRVIDDNNCRYFDSVKVTVYPIDFIPLRDTVVCPGGATVKLKPSVKALPPVNIQWLNTGTYDDSLMVTPHKDSMFVAQLSDGLACNIFDTVEIKVDTIVLSAPDDYICKGDMYTVKPLINARYPYTITWNGVPGTDSLTFKADSTTKFIINIEDIHNCKAVDTVTVINWLSPQALAGSDRNVCHDILQHIKVLPVLGTPPYKILWNNGLTVDSFATYYTSPQVLTVKITDANGCEAFDTVNIQVKPQSQATITPLAPVCETEPEKLLVAFPMGGAWAGPGVSNSRFRPSVAGPGKHPLVYTFTSPYGCPEKDTLVMIVKQLPIPNFYADKTTALPGTTINFTNVTLADTTYTSKWEMGEPAAPGNTISTKDAAYTYNKLGKYIVRLTVNNGLCAPVIAEKNNYIFITDSIVSVPGINNSPFKIYPNPASDRVFIEGATIENVEVFDLQGRRLSCFIIPQDNEVQVAISDLPAGIYYLKIKSGENNYHEKVMIVN